MKISVIVPVYNTEKYIGRCLDSLINQTYKDVQIIVVNDESNDNSLNIIRDYEKKDTRIIVIDKKHGGVSAARNVALEVATGDYISFLDSDDWLDLNTFTVLMNDLMEYKADAIYFQWTEEYYDGTSKIKKTFDNNEIITGKQILTNFFRRDIGAKISSSLISKKIIKNTKFDESLEAGEDMLFGFNVIKEATTIVWAKYPFYHRYNRVGSLSNRNGFIRSDMGLAECTKYMVDYINDNDRAYLLDSLVFSFKFNIVIINKIIFFEPWKKNELSDDRKKVEKNLRQIVYRIKNPYFSLGRSFYMAYFLERYMYAVYKLIVKIHYKYIKKDYGGKRVKE